MYTNIERESVHASPVRTLLSDHLAVRGVITCGYAAPRPLTRLTRDFSQNNRVNFVMSVNSVDWIKVNERNHVATAYATAVINILVNKYDICFPIKRKPNKKRDTSWITPDLINLKSLLFDISRLSDKFPEELTLGKVINDLNNKYNQTLNRTKSNYYNNVIQESNNPSKAMWGVVNTEMGKNNAPKLNFSEIVKDSNGNKFSSPKAAINAMNARFLNASLACAAPKANITAVHRTLVAARSPADRSLRLTDFTADEVFRIVSTRIPPKKAKDIYGLSMDIVRMAVIPLAPVLATLFNKCCREGLYPLPLKTSKVSPIFKGKGKQDDMDGYRPVSIIPAIAKVFENGLSSRIIAYLNETGALSERQYAYREGRSTTSLTREVVHSVLAARERKQHVAVLCCDLSKAFDVADHETLALKLEHYGIAGKAYAVLTDMMRGRSQVVDAGDGCNKSDPLSATIGVAQGSSVSNIMFSLLLNDLPDAVEGADIFMYADDVAAIVTASTIDKLENKMNTVAAALNKWFCVNGLMLNLTKTHFIHFCLSGHSTKPLKVLLDGNRIEQVQSTTFLGFELDRSMSWERHIDKLCGKVGSACFALRRVSRVVSMDVSRACYFATVHSRIQYGAELYARAADWERAFRAQKRAVRAIVGVSQCTSVRPYFKELGILTLPAILIYQVAVYVRNNLDLYTRRGERHSYNIRNADKLVSVSRSLAKSGKSTHVMGPEVYNTLPDKITTAPSVSSFKSRLKRWLIDQTFYDYDEFLSSSKGSTQCL